MKFTSPHQPLVVARSGPNEPVHHIFAPCLHQHRNGQWLMIARWDDTGMNEGEATNSQALFFSQDQGQHWQLAEETPLLSSPHHSSFDADSSLTHAWFLEDGNEITWIYFTVNQPYTWGSDRPHFSTGGGEIRKVKLKWANHTWRVNGPSEIVWGLGQSLPMPHEQFEHHGRVVSWNGAIEIEPRVWAMPIGGRTTSAAPQGAFEKLNRVWLLISRDDAKTWTEAHFVAGNDHQCFAEPTLVKTNTPNQLVCLLRIQYNTGNELHRVQSNDGGRTWTDPHPTGLPQANQQGVKPFLLRRANGAFALIQTNEHDSIARTNIAVFLTDEAGLLTDRWPVVRTLNVGNRHGWWPGCCYGWLAENAAGQLLAAYTREDKDGGQLCISTLDPSEIPSLDTLEPNAVVDELADDRPRVTDWMEHTGQVIQFANVRSRTIAPSFGTLNPKTGGTFSFAAIVRHAPVEVDFPLLRLFSRNGRNEELALLLKEDKWFLRNGGETIGLRWPVTPGNWQHLTVRFSLHDGIQLKLGQHNDPKTVSASLLKPLSTLHFGGENQRETCDVLLTDYQCWPNL